MTIKYLDIAPSKELLGYLRSWLEWAENSAPYCAPYTRKVGLCGNSDRYGNGLDDELCEIFNHELCPFGTDEFFEHKSNATMHLDPNRLAWVRAMIDKYGSDDTNEDQIEKTKRIMNRFFR